MKKTQKYCYLDLGFPKKFLISSYSFMAEEAKYGAVYSIGNALNLNWKTGETGIKPPITREQEMMN